MIDIDGMLEIKLYKLDWSSCVSRLIANPRWPNLPERPTFKHKRFLLHVYE